MSDTITTAAELDALPEMSGVLDRHGIMWQKRDGGGDPLWHAAKHRTLRHNAIALSERGPLMLLRRPDQQPTAQPTVEAVAEVPCEWNDGTGYRCPSCSLFVCVSKRITPPNCPRCIASPLADLGKDIEQACAEWDGTVERYPEDLARAVLALLLGGPLNDRGPRECRLIADALEGAMHMVDDDEAAQTLAKLADQWRQEAGR